MVARIGARTCSFFSIGFGRPAVEAFLQPVSGRAPDGAVRPGLDARFEVAVKRSQPVLNHGLGLAGDLASDPLPVWAEPEADRAAPSALAVPVPVAVTARRHASTGAPSRCCLPTRQEDCFPAVCAQTCGSLVRNGPEPVHMQWKCWGFRCLCRNLIGT
jgi:hypothetical protein